MSSFFLRVAAAVLAGSLLGSANAQGIDTVTSSVDTDGGDGIVSSAVGGVLTIDGLGFGTAKPKVFLLDEATGKKYVLKVTSFSDQQIFAEIKKAVLGELQLNVQPNGADPFTFDSVVIERPDVGELLAEDFVTPIDEASPGLAFYISGEYFGTKRGKLSIGGKKAKVITWAMTGILLEMPKKLANGLWDILLDNKVGTDDETAITMIGSTVKIGKATFNFYVNGNKVNLKYGLGAAPGGYAVVAVGTSGTNPSKSAVVAVPFLDGDQTPEDYVFGTDLFVVSYIETGKFVLGGPPPTINAGRRPSASP
ncbi:MAG: hypothetical protein FJ296_04250 [Planctomycetes bacterium]|nr:hypothetical protein [Planctomycetota bacterium]